MKEHDGPKFKGVTIDTETNRKTVMSKVKYQADEREFRRKTK